MLYLDMNQEQMKEQMIQDLKQEERRYLKAQQITKVGHIHQFQGESNRWFVQSESDRTRYYIVTVDKDFECCTCPDSQFRGNVCKHLLATCLKYTRIV